MKRVCIEDILQMFIFAAIMVVGFIFLCTDAEYNYNQQIARGFISKDAIFFSIDDLSYEEAFYVHFTVDSDSEELVSFYGNHDTTPIKESDPSFQLQNSVYESGTTSVEMLLSSSDRNYMASLHNGLMRGVYYRGNISFPPLISGRFFTEEECLNDNPLIVIGKNYEQLVIERNEKNYINYNSREYEVIGIVGMSSESPIDDIVFVNVGSLTPEEQLQGMYYIDCSEDNYSVYSDFLNVAQLYFGCGLKQRNIPTTYIDVVSGGMYLKSYFKIVLFSLFLFTFFNVFIQTMKKRNMEIAVMKIEGISLLRIHFHLIRNSIVAAILGSLIGIIINVAIVVFGVFSLPKDWLVNYGNALVIIEVIMISIWCVFALVNVCRQNPKEVVQKL